MRRQGFGPSSYRSTADVENCIKSAILMCILQAMADGIANREFTRGALAMGQSLCVSIGSDWRNVKLSLQKQAKTGDWAGLLEEACQ